jgi:hypothetical protein
MSRLVVFVLCSMVLAVTTFPANFSELDTQKTYSTQGSNTPQYVIDSFESLNSTDVSFVVSLDSSIHGMVGCAEFSGTLDNAELDADGIASSGGKDILVFGWNQTNGYWSTTLGSAGNEFCWKTKWINETTIAISGYFDEDITIGSTTLINNGGRDGFIATYDIAIEQWDAAASIGTDQNEEFRSFTALSNGTFAALSTSTGNVANYSSLQGAKNCTSSDISISTCTMVVYLDQQLLGTGMQVLQSTKSVIGGDIAEIASTGKILVTGYFSQRLLIGTGYIESVGNTTTDIFVCRLSSNGQFESFSAFGGMGNDEARSIAKTSTGFVVSGTTESTNNSQSRVYKPSLGWEAAVGNGFKDNLILHVTSLGLIVDGFTFGTEKMDAVGEISVDENDFVYMSGYIGSTFAHPNSNATLGITDKRSAYVAIINISGGNSSTIHDMYATTGSNNGDARTNSVSVLNSQDIWIGGRMTPGRLSNTFFGEHTSGYSKVGFLMRIGFDSDSDGVAERIDNCPSHHNPNQANYDGDGMGDNCDLDDDGDGVLDVDDIECSYSTTVGFVSNQFNDHDGDGCEDSTEDDDDDNDGYSDTYESNLDCPKGITNWSAGELALDRDADGCHDQLEDLDDDGDSYLDATDDACGMANSIVFDVNTWMDRDLDGCHDDEDLDVDNDGILNAQDACDASLIGWQSDVQSDYDQDGCHDLLADLDDDNDGVSDYFDMCTPPSTYSTLGTSMLIPWTDYDGDGCHDLEEDMDDDNDGILDTNDSCQLGTTSWTSTEINDYDSDGCQDSIEDTDDDGDALEDHLDECDPDSGFQSLKNWSSNIATDHDADGCSDDGEISSGIEEDSDDDNDGIADVIDGIDGNCRRSNLALEPVDYDSDGCFDGEDDDMDNDAMENSIDACPRSISLQFKSTPLNDHDADGCEDDLEDQDDDNDGIDDADDVRCQTGDLFTSSSETDWDEDGCKDSTEDNDDDNDGIIDTMDQCDVEDGVFTENLPWTSGPNTDYDQDGCRDVGSENGDQGEDDDDDNDGVKDYQEGLDINGAPCLYTRQPSIDDDKDGCANYEDPDDDNDGVTDAQETKIAGDDAMRKQNLSYLAIGMFGLVLVAAFRKNIYQVAGDWIHAINSAVNTGAGDQSVGNPGNSPSPIQQNPTDSNQVRNGITLVLNFKPGQLSQQAFDAAMLEMVGANFYATKGTLQKTLNSDEKKMILKLNQDGWNVTVARSLFESIACKHFIGASNAHSIQRLDLNIRFSIINPRELSEDIGDEAGRVTSEQFWMSVLAKSQVLSSWMKHNKEELRNKFLSTLQQSTSINFIEDECSFDIETYSIEELRQHPSYRSDFRLELNMDCRFGVVGSLKILGEASGQLVMDNLETNVIASGTLCVLDTVHFDNTAEDLLILYPKDEQFWEFIRRLN